PQAIEGMPSSPAVTATFTDANNLAVAQLKATIDYGDGTALSTGTIMQTAPNTYMVTDTHTFPEESGSTVPPFAFTATLHVFEPAAPPTPDTKPAAAQVLDAPLAPGNPINAGTPQQFKGVDAAGARAALASFETAIGGKDNGANPPPAP